MAVGDQNALKPMVSNALRHIEHEVKQVLDPDVERGGLSELRILDLSSGQPLALSGIMGSFSPFTLPGWSDYSGGVFIGATKK